MARRDHVHVHTNFMLGPLAFFFFKGSAPHRSLPSPPTPPSPDLSPSGPPRRRGGVTGPRRSLLASAPGTEAWWAESVRRVAADGALARPLLLESAQRYSDLAM